MVRARSKDIMAVFLGPMQIQISMNLPIALQRSGLSADPPSKARNRQQTCECEPEDCHGVAFVAHVCQAAAACELPAYVLPDGP